MHVCMYVDMLHGSIAILAMHQQVLLYFFIPVTYSRSGTCLNCSARRKICGIFSALQTPRVLYSFFSPPPSSITNGMQMYENIYIYICVYIYI